MEAKHTWHYEQAASGGYIIHPSLPGTTESHLPHPSPIIIGRIGREEDARRAVAAVNSHDELLAALERVVASCEAHNSGGPNDYDWIGEAEAALAKAKGGP